MLPDVERELIRRCRAGDSRFYEPLVRAYEPTGLRIALGILGNRDDAHDALQDAFVNAFKTLERFQPDRPFGPWFFQILRNRCRDLLRSRNVRFKTEVLDASMHLQPSDPEDGPERKHQRVTAKEVLWKGLEEIGEDHREVLVLKELEGMRYGEIAGILDIPEGTVASRLFHARAALRDALESLGVTYP